MHTILLNEDQCWIFLSSSWIFLKYKTKGNNLYLRVNLHRFISLVLFHRGQSILLSSVTRILLGGGVSVSDTYRIWIHPGYASDTFPAVSWKNRYILAWKRVSDTFGPDGIWPKVVVSPIRPPKFRFETTSTPPSPFFCCFGSKRWHEMMNARQ